MRTDVLFLAHNRIEFTRFSFEMLLANTNWDLVRELHVYDDSSVDGTREWLYERLQEARSDELLKIGLASFFHETDFGSPVAIMNDYVAAADSLRFAKIDNDIIVPAGWLEALTVTMDANPSVECLGMESGRMGVPYRDGAEWDGIYTAEPARWIGGVGLVRTATLGERPQIIADGRFGWTEMQREYELACAWIKPDLQVTELSRIPFEPWLSISNDYRARDMERNWPRYHERWGEWYWEWWPEDHARYAEGWVPQAPTEKDES